MQRVLFSSRVACVLNQQCRRHIVGVSGVARVLFKNNNNNNNNFSSSSLTRTTIKKNMVVTSTPVHTDAAPAAIGPYSQAIRTSNDMLFVSGCIGLHPTTMELAPDLESQTEQVMKNMGAILEAGGSGFDRVVKTTVLLRDMADYAKVNEIYGKHFTKNYPARAAFAVAGLPRNALVEIECVAIVGPPQ